MLYVKVSIISHLVQQSFRTYNPTYIAFRNKAVHVKIKMIMQHTNKESDIALIIAVAAGTYISITSSNFSPLLIGVLADSDIVAEITGAYILTLEICAIPVATFIVLPFIQHINRQRLAIAGVMFATIAQLISPFFLENYDLFITRFCVGLGLGCVYAAVNSVGATSKNPDKVFGYSTAITFLLYAITQPLMSMIIGIFGFSGACIFLTMAGFISLLFIRNFPSEPSIVEQQKVEVHWRYYIALLITIILFNLAAGTTWAFVERVGVSRFGLDIEIIGLILGIGTAAGVVGAYSATWAYNHLDRINSILFGLVLSGATSYGITNSTTISVYTGSIILYWFIYLFLYPLLFSAAAELDRSGRLATITGGLLWLAVGIGPAVGGLIASRYTYDMIGWFSLFCCVLAVPCFFWVGRYLETRHERSSKA